MSTPPETLNKLELERLIRVARAARDDVVSQKLLMQERELTIGDGDIRHVRETILTCENEVFILTSAIAKLWRMLYPMP
jgi:hypothetical protein